MAKRGHKFSHRVTYSHAQGTGVACMANNYDEAVIYARQYAARLVLHGVDGEYGVDEVDDNGVRRQVVLISTVDIDEDEAADIMSWA